MNQFDIVSREVVLERLRFVSSTMLSPHIMREAKLDTYLMPAMEGLVVRLSVEIAGKTEQVVDEKFPTDWWQAFKERWFPDWLRRRYPVQYRYIKVDKQTLFPTIEIPKHDATIRLNIWDRVSYEEYP